MELLELVERTDNIFFVGQILCDLTETGLGLEILLEILVAGDAVQTEHVVKLLDIQLIVAPELIGLLGGHVLDFTPLLLEGLELLIALVGFLGCGNHGLDLVDDGQFLCQIFQFFYFLFFKELGTLLFDNAHLGLEGFLDTIGNNLILVGIAATINECLDMGFALGNVEFVEGCLQVVNLFFLRGLITVGNLTYTLQDLCLGGIDLLWLLFLGFYLRS